MQSFVLIYYHDNYTSIIMQLDPNRIKFNVTCTVTPRPVVPPNLVAYIHTPLSQPPLTHPLIPFLFRLSTCTKSVGEHWQLPRLYRGSRRELLGVRVLPHGHHEHRGVRRRRLHDHPRPDWHRVFPALRTGKWAGRHSGPTRLPDPPSLNKMELMLPNKVRSSTQRTNSYRIFRCCVIDVQLIT